MDNVHNIGNSLTRPEIGAIIGYLVEHNKKIDLVKSQFEHIFSKRVSAQTIKMILTKHMDEIDARRSAWLDAPEGQDFYHLTERLKEWKKLYEMSLEEGAIVVNVKLDKDTYDVERKPDLKTAAAILKGAAWDKHSFEKLQLERAKLDLIKPPDSEDDEEESEDKAFKWA